MYKALPAIAVTAAGVTWLLHAQGVIDADAASSRGAAGAQRSGGSSPANGGSGAGPGRGTTPTTAAPSTTTSRPRRGDDDQVRPRTPSSRASTTTTTPPSTSSGDAAPATVDGPVVDTRFGPVQVEVTITGGRIVEVTTPEYPDEARRSRAINDQALPLLRQQVLDAQSANIDGVGGATYTAEAYVQSLQAALDKAGFKR